jgi:hypothetical protein
VFDIADDDVGNDCTNGMATNIIISGITTTIPKKSCAWSTTALS